MSISCKAPVVTVLLVLSSFSFAQKPERDDPRGRAEWFYSQRAYPFKKIPHGARQRSLRQRETLRVRDAASSSKSATATISQTRWTFIGPQPINAGSSGPFAGRVTALAIDPRNSNVVYTGTADGGVWKTTNGGTTWVPLTDFAPALAIGSLALDPTNPNIVYAGTGEGDFADSYLGNGLLKSTDGGANWATITQPFTGGGSLGSRIAALAIQPNNGQVILASAAISCLDLSCTPSGIFRSVDGGTTWTNVLPTETAVTVLLFDPQDPNVAYASVGAGGFSSDPTVYASAIYKSTDSGATWRLAVGSGTTALPNNTSSRWALAISPSNPSVLYTGMRVTLDARSQVTAIYKSTDGAQSWVRLPNAPDYCNPQCIFDNVLVVHPLDPNVVLAGGIYLYNSLDGGTSWNYVGNNIHVDHHAFAYTGDGSKLYVGNDGGAYISTNSNTASPLWTNLNATLGITEFYPGHSIDVASASRGFGGTQDNGELKYTGSAAWDNVVCGDGGWSNIDFTNNNNVYATCQGNYIVRSVDGGSSWQPANAGIVGNDVAFIPPLVMDPSNPQRLYFGNTFVHRSDNSAQQWSTISSFLGGVAYAIAVAPSDPNTVYVSATRTLQVARNALSTSPAWADRSVGLPGRYITQIVVSSRDADLAYVALSGFYASGADLPGHVYQTHNGGTNWTNISGDLPDAPVTDLVLDPDAPNTLYAATDVGVFTTTDGGASWHETGTSLPNVVTMGVKLHRASRILRVGTHGRGMWDLQLPPAIPTVSLSPTTSNLGYELVGSTGSAQTFILANDTASAVNITGITTTGDFGQTNDCNSTLPAGAACHVNVTFHPTTTGVRTGSVQVTDSSATSSHRATLNGTGVTAGTTLSPNSAGFGNQPVGTISAAQGFALANSTSSAAAITGITTTGDFRQTNNCGNSLAVGSSCTISVTFQPSVTGSRGGSLQVSDSSPSSQHSATLSGIGTTSAGCASSTVNPSVTICTPMAGVTVASPVQVVAQTNDSRTVDSVQIFVDGASKYKISGRNVNTMLAMASGTRRLTVQAHDASGAYFKQTVYITVSGATSSCNPSGTPPSITICLPAENSTVASPVHITAAANDANPIIDMQVYVDGVRKYDKTNVPSIDVFLAMTSGRRRVTVQAKDSLGQILKKTVYIGVN